MTGQSVMAEQDNGVYRRLSADMRRGLKDIYQQISTASNDTAIDGRKTDALFTEASDQLDEVVKATESAAMSIMEIVERHFEQQAESAAIIARIKAGDASAADIDKLAAINDSLGADLNSVLTTLSFQDITGQRIKKVVAALNAIEDSVVQLYISSGLIMEGRREIRPRTAIPCRRRLRKPLTIFAITARPGLNSRARTRMAFRKTPLTTCLPSWACKMPGGACAPPFYFIINSAPRLSALRFTG